MTTQDAPRRRRLTWLWWLIGIVVVLGVLVVVADIAGRAYAEGRVADEIESRLPAGVEGDVDVTIGGGSFLAQLASGRIDQVDLDAPSLVANGVPFSAHVTATGVPTDLTRPVEHATGTFALDQAAVDSVVTLPEGASLQLGDGTVSYDQTGEFLGIQLGYTVTGEVTAQGTSVRIEPTGAELTQGSNALDVSGLLDRVIGSAVTVCVAQYLPQGVSLQTLEVTPGQASVVATLDDFVLDESTLSTLGTC
ncbi:hypothetical protein GCM10010988_06980 [Cnuibacter physcomitrellae]|uniref:Uncharacterized protein n=1 Tax=Cnuibacter physcomitrellae TaxID=1619308 RepID=A0A1X9LK61_9MICO|nr:DUF2993 domain-containing protein [Cnuibacter physcomitrellae]ARJ05596.1 hypothetical protein B5808_10435 [Cnuibacter physcomitrellae]GGI36044.1 hypothetical protein GCM10010988_06980 [Cnuibacter physcomitrellae]